MESRGFTLIELLIAVAIVAILGAIAYPSYTDYVLRGRIVDATNGLSTAHAQMEQYYQDTRSYESGPCENVRTFKSFSVACLDAPTATRYTITATGSGATDGFVFTIDQDGTQKTTGLPAHWGAVPAGGHACWIARRGDAC